MAISILDKERKYCIEYSNLSEKLEGLYADLIQDDIINLEDNQITLAVLERLK